MFSISDHSSPLGRPALYADQYDPSLLFPIARADKRSELGIDNEATPFFGADLWTAFELGWLNRKGKPQVAIAHIVVPCETPNIVESKSFKLYLNSLNNTVFDDADAVRDRIRDDLGELVSRGSGQTRAVGVRLVLPDTFGRQRIEELEGLSLDRLDVDCSHYTPAPELLGLVSGADQAPVAETLVSNLLKSNCLVTGQPDWGSMQIRYTGRAIDQAGLLRYLVSYRNHHEFHEQCVERIFMDIWQRCQPLKLAVLARYTRRGGLDISPFRTSHPAQLPGPSRTARQ